MQKISKRIYLEDLPLRKEGIDWRKSVGSNIYFEYDNINGYIKITSYEVSSQKITLEYNNKIVTIGTSDLLECKIGNLIGKNVTNFRYAVGDIIKANSGNIQIIGQLRDKNRHKRYKYKCLNDGYVGELSENDFVTKQKGCPVCCNRKIIQGINDMWTTNPKQAKLLANKEDGYQYSQSANKKVDWKCPDCGEIIKNKCINNVYFQGLSCPKCGDGVSYPEKLMYNILKQLRVDFKYQLNKTTFEWCDKYKYDFYLTDYQIIIETDGGFHYHDNSMNGQTLEEILDNDMKKDILAKEHGIKLIRVSCYPSDFELIKNNILNSELADIFNLQTINWSECQKYAVTSLVKTACDIWNSGIHSTIEIGNIMNLSMATIIKYLKKGYICGYCDYQTPQQIKRSVNYKQ